VAEAMGVKSLAQGNNSSRKPQLSIEPGIYTSAEMIKRIFDHSVGMALINYSLLFVIEINKATSMLETGVCQGNGYVHNALKNKIAFRL